MRSGACLAAALLALAGCDVVEPEPPVRPEPRPAGIAAPAPPSAASTDLRRYYLAVQNDLLVNGLLRTDGGGPDTPYDADDLVRNFERIAFYDEYTRSSRTAPGGSLSRWDVPVRVGIEFGPSVAAAQRSRDSADIRAYADRLARVTGHPVQVASARTNFHVFVAGEDDRDFIQARLRQLVPDISDHELALFRDLPRSFYCFVVAVSDPGHPDAYAHAAALIRAEHPDLVRLSCIHEELAQGLGLPNDSPRARPSIFNDDDEFALLTSHDEKLLKMLYDPRLTPGMTAAAARPITRVIAAELMGTPQ